MSCKNLTLLEPAPAMVTKKQLLQCLLLQEHTCMNFLLDIHSILSKHHRVHGFLAALISFLHGPYLSAGIPVKTCQRLLSTQTQFHHHSEKIWFLQLAKSAMRLLCSLA